MLLSHAFCIIFCTIGICFEPATASWWSSTPEETTPSTTEDAECDWSLDNEMAVDEGDSSGTLTVNIPGSGYTQQGQGQPNGYSGNGYVMQPNGGVNTASGNIYTTQDQNAYQSQGGVYNSGNENGYNGNGYPTGGSGVPGNGYPIGGSGIPGNGYPTDGSGVPGNGYPTGGSGVTGNGYMTGGGGVISGNGYVSSSYYVSPQAQQGFAKRETFAYINEYDYVGLHPRYPIGSYVQVTNPDDFEPRSVLVQIVGRPKELALGRCLTLSKAAFAQIADLNDGVTHCIVTLT